MPLYRFYRAGDDGHILGMPDVVIIRYENEAAYDKFYNGGGKEWIDKNAPQAREVEGMEQK
jgi:hypothetical protein